MIQNNNNKKIAHIFLGKHFEIIGSLCDILKHVSKEYKHHFFVDKDTFEEFKTFHQTYEWSIITKQNIKSELRKISNYNLIIFDTVEIFLREFSEFDNQNITIYRVHNLNYWLDNNYKKLLINAYNSLSRFDLKSFIKIINLIFIKKEHVYRKRFLDKINFVTFCDLQLNLHAKTINNFYPIIDFPTSFYIGNYFNNKEFKKLKIIVPGEIIEDKRNFDLFVDAIKEINPVKSKLVRCELFNNKKSKYAKKILDQIKNANPSIELIIHDNFVSQENFTDLLKKSHIILCPLKVDIKYRGVQEYYGKSKTSGGFGDFFRYGLIPIFPRDYFLDKELKRYFETYNNGLELKKIIEYYCNLNNLDKKMNDINNFLLDENKKKLALIEKVFASIN